MSNELFKNNMCVIVWKKPFLYLNVKEFKRNKKEHDEFMFALKKIYEDLYNKKIKFCQIYNIIEIETDKPYKMINYITNFSKFLKSQEYIITNFCYSVSILIKNKKIISGIINKFLSDNKRPIILIDDLEKAHKWSKKHIDANKFN